MKSFTRIIAAAALLMALSPVYGAFSSKPRGDMWMTDYDVECIEEGDGVIYVAGFMLTYAGPNTGYAALVDGSTGAVDSSFPKIGDYVSAIIPDGKGGWFIGGGRGGSGDVGKLVHVKSDNSLDSAFKPVIAGAFGEIKALALSPDRGTLYIGGYFTTIGGQTRNNIAAIDSATGAVKSWNPDSNGTVNALSLSPDGKTVYAAGWFVGMGGQERNRIAAISAVTGAVSSWNPGVSSSSEADVRAVVPSPDGKTVYVAGSFDTCAGVPRNCLAAIDSITGSATSWNPNPQGGYFGGTSFVKSLVLSSDGKTAFVGGNFTSIGGVNQAKLAAISTSTGTVSAWNPGLYNSDSTYVSSLALSDDGGTLFAAGSFTQIGGGSHVNFAALDTSTAAAEAWTPMVPTPVTVISQESGKVCLGGTFLSVGGEPRELMAAIDIKTGKATAFNPAPSGGDYPSVQAMQISADGKTLFVGGSFSQIGGQARNNIAALDASTGLATDWTADASAPVLALAMSPSNDTLYVGGSFDTLNGSARNYIAALDPATGELKDWAPDISSASSGNVQAIAVSPDGKTVYVGGSFDHAGGALQDDIAAIDAATGAVLAWNPNLKSESPLGSMVTTLTVSPDGSILYAGGWFNKVGDGVRNKLAAIYTSSALPTPWDPQLDAEGSSYHGSVRSISLSKDGTVLYVAGYFTNVGGQTRWAMAGIYTGSGLPTSWNPSPGDPIADAVHVSDDGSSLFAGGDFRLLDGIPCPHLACFGQAATHTLTFTAETGGSVSQGSQEVEDGTDSSPVTATPDEGYLFSKWAGPDGFSSAANPLVVQNVTKDMAFTAEFVQGGYSTKNKFSSARSQSPKGSKDSFSIDAAFNFTGGFSPAPSITKASELSISVGNYTFSGVLGDAFKSSFKESGGSAVFKPETGETVTVKWGKKKITASVRSKEPLNSERNILDLSGESGKIPETSLPDCAVSVGGFEWAGSFLYSGSAKPNKAGQTAWRVKGVETAE